MKSPLIFLLVGVGGLSWLHAQGTFQQGLNPTYEVPRVDVTGTSSGSSTGGGAGGGGAQVNGQGRTFGISYVTRRTPTAGAGMGARNFFTASGVPLDGAASVAGSAAVVSSQANLGGNAIPTRDSVRRLAGSKVPLSIQDVMTLKQAASRGDAIARRRLAEEYSPVADEPGTPARKITDPRTSLPAGPKTGRVSMTNAVEVVQSGRAKQ